MILIDLRNIKTGGLRAFRFDEAANLFKLEKQLGVKCWELPEDSKYSFKDGRFIYNGRNKTD